MCPSSTLNIHAAGFAMSSCNRLGSSILIAWSVARLGELAFHCRRPYPPDGRGLVPGIQYPRVAGYEMVGIVDAIGTNVSGALRDTGSEPARRRFPGETET